MTAPGSLVGLEAGHLKEASLSRRPFFEGIGYASCWEDPAVLRASLRVRPGEAVFSIASGGCNVLSLLLDDPGRIEALDFNPHQIRLLRLKMAAAAHLSREDVLALVGVLPSGRRPALWRELRLAVPEADRAWWEQHPEAIRDGLYRSGRTDRYLMAFGTLVRLVMGRKKVARLFACRTLDEQRAFYAEAWNDWRWRAMLAAFFHRRVISWAKDPTHFRFVEGEDFGRRIHARAETLFETGLMRDNWFVALILLGRYHEDGALPPWLTAEGLPRVRAGLERLSLVEGSLADWLARSPAGAWDAFNLSNLYDWLDDEARAGSLKAVVQAARPGARLCYWSTLAPRPLPAVEGLRPEPELAASLARQDRFPYAGFAVATVAGTTPQRV